MASSPITSWQVEEEKVETVTDFTFLSSKITVDGDCSHEIKRCLLLGRKAITNLDNVLKSKDVTLPTNICIVKSMVSPVIMCWYESWNIKKADHWRTDAFKLCWRRILSFLDCKEIKPVNSKGNQSWIFIGRTDAEAETPVLWPPDGKNWLIGKDPNSGKYWRWEEKGMTADEMLWFHHQLYGHEFEQTLGVGDGQGSLACCSPWGCRVRHGWVTELNWHVRVWKSS